jgi:hypothetical protein
MIWFSNCVQNLANVYVGAFLQLTISYCVSTFADLYKISNNWGIGFQSIFCLFINYYRLALFKPVSNIFENYK